jgi:hypothetical protein
MYVQELIRESTDMMPRSTSNLRYELKPMLDRHRKKYTDQYRGVTPVVMSRSTIDNNNIHRKDLQF